MIIFVYGLLWRIYMNNFKDELEQANRYKQYLHWFREFHKDRFTEEEISIRFKHKLVAIHLFPNGNGRHSRLLGDIMMRQVFRKPIFSWGQKNLVDKGKTRET